MERYLLCLAGVDKPRVCFIPTASGDADGYLLKFYQAFSGAECIPTHLSLFRLPSEPLEEFVLKQDIIFYVGGGNTKSLLALWREWGLDTLLRRAYEGG